jgi:branched-chain amino acid transport system substrate-binding protein
LTRLIAYLLLLATLLPYRSYSQEQPNNASINIGLLLPDPSLNEVIKAAELATEKANAEGGYLGQEFKLVIRTTEGFWGAGSKESVNLVYDDDVRGIVGSLDGRNGHLAEQVAAKSQLTYIETFTTDPTLSQAFVPWFMRVVPNDNQQATLLFKQIEKNGGGKVCILSQDTYDTKYAVRSLTKTAAHLDGSPPLVIDLTNSNIQNEEITRKIVSAEINHLVLPFDSEYLKDIILSLKQLNPQLNIYGTLHFTMGAESRKIPWSLYEGIIMVAPLQKASGSDQSFQDSRSAYVYDAVSLLIRAIHQVGTDREAIKDYLTAAESYRGVTGSISFDELGNRQDASTMIRIQSGVPQIIKNP